MRLINNSTNMIEHIATHPEKIKTIRTDIKKLQS